MRTKRLQLMLIPDSASVAQPLTPQARAQSVEHIALMLLSLVYAAETEEVRDDAE